MTRDIVLRQATLSDWPAVASVLAANRLPLDGAREHLPAYLVAARDGEVVGCAGAEIYDALVLVRSVAVAPGLQGQGIGKMLVSGLLQQARRRRVAALYLLTNTAPEYFARFGFRREPIEQAPDALKASAEFQGACPSSAVFMSRPLGERSDVPALDRI